MLSLSSQCWGSIFALWKYFSKDGGFRLHNPRISNLGFFQSPEMLFWKSHSSDNWILKNSRPPKHRFGTTVCHCWKTALLSSWVLIFVSLHKLFHLEDSWPFELHKWNSSFIFAFFWLQNLSCEDSASQSLGGPGRDTVHLVCTIHTAVQFRGCNIALNFCVAQALSPSLRRLWTPW